MKQPKYDILLSFFFNVRCHWDLPGMLCDAFHESIFIPLFMCKRIYLSGLCSYIVELHIPGFFLPAGKIAFEKDLHSIQMNLGTYSFRISIDSIIFPWFFSIHFYVIFHIDFSWLNLNKNQGNRKKKYFANYMRLYFLASSCEPIRIASDFTRVQEKKR